MAGQPRSVTEIRDKLVMYLAERLEIEPRAVNVTQPLVDFGLASREAIELVGYLEDWLQRELAPTLFWDYPSIAALAQYLGAGEASGEVAVDLPDSRRQPPADEPAPEQVLSEPESALFASVLRELEEASLDDLQAALAEAQKKRDDTL